MNVPHPSAFLAMGGGWMQLPDRPPMPPNTAHLWFLYYLLLFGVLHWVARTLGLGRLGQWLVRRPPAWLLAGLPLPLLPALASVSAPHPAPDGLLPQFWAIVFYGSFFALGTLVHGQPDWLARARPAMPWLAVGCPVLYATFLSPLAAALPGQAPPTTS